MVVSGQLHAPTTLLPVMSPRQSLYSRLGGPNDTNCRWHTARHFIQIAIIYWISLQLDKKFQIILHRKRNLLHFVKRPERVFDCPPHLATTLKKQYSCTSAALWVFVACSGVSFTFLPFHKPSMTEGREGAVSQHASWLVSRGFSS